MRGDWDSLQGFAANLAHLMEQEAAAGFDAAAIDEGVFGRLALALFRLQVRSNKCYRRFVEYSLGMVGGARAWWQIPCVSVSAFKEFEMTSLPVGERLLVFRSSGTAGRKRSRHFHSRESLALYERSLGWWFWHHFQRAGAARLFVLTPDSVEAPDSSLVYMFETVRRGGDFSGAAFYGRGFADGGWDLDAGRLLEDLRGACRRGLPVALLGTAFNYVQLLETLDGAGWSLSLPAGSCLLETGGYKGRTRELAKAELYRRLAAGLGIGCDRMISEYGMSELSSQAYDGRLGGGDRARVFRFPPWARCQVVSAETGMEAAAGETGLIRVFDLANVWSVLAVQTEDMGRRTAGGVELLGRASEAEARGCSLMPEA